MLYFLSAIIGLLVYFYLQNNNNDNDNSNAKSIRMKIYTDEHVMNLSQQLAKLKLSALRFINQGHTETARSEVFIQSSADVRIMYDVKLEDSYVHYISLSHTSEKLTKNTASDLITLITIILKLDKYKFDFQYFVSDNGVYHFRFTLNEEQHTHYMKTPILQFTSSQHIRQTFVQAIKTRSKYLETLTTQKIETMDMGMMSYALGQLDIAALCFLDAIEENPCAILPHFLLAQIAQEKNMSEAQNFLKRGLQLCEEQGKDPKDFGVEINRADA